MGCLSARNPSIKFKYLGMHFNPSATPAFAATHMRAGMFLAMRQACKRAREYGVLHDPYALCHFIRAFVLPLGLYGSQVWGTAFLGHGVQLSNPVQTRMLSFLRFAARVRASGSGQQEDEGQGQGEQEVIAERRQVIKAALRGLVEAARPDLSPEEVDAVVAQVNQRMTMGSMQCCLAAVMSLTMLLQSFLVQLDIEDPNLLPQIKAAMDLLTNASVQEHLMCGPHHSRIRLLPGEVAVYVM
ncbi:hypothetical protein QJQ45_004413 [Haematococcus lacustris]|nr:hypothetical protein QJQ45_004413 [Haematococcus lacustris]